MNNDFFAVRDAILGNDAVLRTSEVLSVSVGEKVGTLNIWLRDKEIPLLTDTYDLYGFATLVLGMSDDQLEILDREE